MRIAHISDTHLGFRQYGLQEREEDFKKAFVDAFEKIAELPPDVVVHTGDLFDYPHPPTRAQWVLRLLAASILRVSRGIIEILGHLNGDAEIKAKLLSR